MKAEESKWSRDNELFVSDRLRSLELVLVKHVRFFMNFLVFLVGRKERCQKQWLHRERFVF